MPPSANGFVPPPSIVPPSQLACEAAVCAAVASAGAAAGAGEPSTDESMYFDEKLPAVMGAGDAAGAVGGTAGSDAAARRNARADAPRPHGEVDPVEVMFHPAAKVRDSECLRSNHISGPTDTLPRSPPHTHRR